MSDAAARRSRTTATGPPGGGDAAQRLGVLGTSAGVPGRAGLPACNPGQLLTALFSRTPVSLVPLAPSCRRGWPGWVCLCAFQDSCRETCCGAATRAGSDDGAAGRRPGGAHLAQAGADFGASRRRWRSTYDGADQWKHTELQGCTRWLSLVTAPLRLAACGLRLGNQATQAHTAATRK